MSWGNFLKTAAGGVGTLLGGPVGGAVAGGVAGMLVNRQQAGAMQRAGQQAAQQGMQGFNWLSQNPMIQQQMAAGQQAHAQQQALLGLGGDPAAAQQAFQQWQDSTGFQHRLNTGQQAITGNAAASGMLGSGSTLKALQQHGQNLGTQSFDNYFAQLGGLGQGGMAATGMLGQAAAQGGAVGAQAMYGAGMGAADARAQGWDSLFGGVSGGLGAWNRGRQQPTTAGFTPSANVPGLHSNWAGLMAGAPKPGAMPPINVRPMTR